LNWRGGDPAKITRAILIAILFRNRRGFGAPCPGLNDEPDYAEFVRRLGVSVPATVVRQA